MGRRQVMMDGIDTDLSKACDKLLEARDEHDRAKAGEKQAVLELVGCLRDHNVSSVKHNGRTFAIRVTEAKELIKVVE